MCSNINSRRKREALFVNVFLIISKLENERGYHFCEYIQIKLAGTFKAMYFGAVILGAVGASNSFNKILENRFQHREQDRGQRTEYRG